MFRSLHQLHLCRIAACAFLIVGLSASASAQVWPQNSSEDTIPLQLQKELRAGLSVEGEKKKMMSLFSQTDLDGGGVSENDYTLAKQLMIAQHRSGAISRWTAMDLNGDGSVTTAELKVFFTRQARRQFKSDGVEIALSESQVQEAVSKQIDAALKDDSNGDGSVSLTEATAAADVDYEPRIQRPIPLSADENNDGIVSRKEYEDGLDRAFASVDTDGDGMFSEDEIKALRKKMAEVARLIAISKRMGELKQTCGLPEVPDAAELITIGVKRSDTLSSVSLGGDHYFVMVADVAVEPGPQPIYVLLQAYGPVIWRFTGATERVIEVVVTAGMRSEKSAIAGVIGIPKDRVLFPDSFECVPNLTTKVGTKPGEETAMTMRALYGREADVLIRKEIVRLVNIPSGDFDDQARLSGTANIPMDGPGAPFWEQAMAASPGGLVMIEPSAVVSPVPAKNYEVLPGPAGLAQLMDEGAIEVAETREVFRVGTTTIIPGEGDDTIFTPPGVPIKMTEEPAIFTVLKKIRLPAGVERSNYQFKPAPGVPEPERTTGQE